MLAYVVCLEELHVPATHTASIAAVTNMTDDQTAETPDPNAKNVTDTSEKFVQSLEPIAEQLVEKEMPKKPVPFPPAISEINALADFYPEPYALMFRTMYLYGARVSETLKLMPRDFELTQDEDGRDVLLATLVTLKNKTAPLRVIPAIISGENLTDFQKEEAAITQHLMETLTHQTDRTARLFDTTRQRSFNMFFKQTYATRAIDPKTKTFTMLEDFKIHPHFLRHARLTHLVEEYPEYGNAIALMKYAGWSDPRPASVYLNLDWRHLARAMRKAPRTYGTAIVKPSDRSVISPQSRESAGSAAPSNGSSQEPQEGGKK